MLLITNKSSNIIEDLDTLHIMAKLVPIYCISLEEKYIKKFAFELIFALDEVISAGHKEKVSVSRIKTLTEMDSHEEKIHDIVERNQQRNANETAKQKMKEIQSQKKLGAKMGGMGYNSGMGSGSGSGYKTTPSAIPQRSEPSYQSKPVSKKPAKKGMQLKAKSTQSSEYLKALQDIGELAEETETMDAYGVEAAVVETIQKKGIHVELEETISVQFSQDSGLEGMELKGELRIEIIDATFSHICVQLAKPSKKFQFRTHPNINKTKFTKDAVLALKDTSKAFPMRTPLGVLKWRFASTEESDLPISVTCWPTPGDGMMTVNLEYELLQPHLELQNVAVCVPIPHSHTPVVESADGEYDFDTMESCLVWKLPIVDSDNGEGSMEFTLPYNGDPAALFPVDVRFTSVTPYSGVQITSVNSIADNSVLDYSDRIVFSAQGGDFQLLQ